MTNTRRVALGGRAVKGRLAMAERPGWSVSTGSQTRASACRFGRFRDKCLKTGHVPCQAAGLFPADIAAGRGN